MGDRNRPRSKTGRSTSSSNLKGRTGSKADSVTDVESVSKVENTIPWDVFNLEQLADLLPKSPSEILKELCSLLSLTATHINLKNSIRADLFLLAVHFAKQQKFSDLEAGGLLTLFDHMIHLILKDKALLDLVSKSSQLLTCKKEFKEGQTFDFFSPDQVISITAYLESTIFQHFQLYRYCLLKEQEETIISLDKIVSTCPPLGSFDPPPLAEAISDHDIEMYLKAQPSPEPELEAGADETEEDELKTDEEKEVTPLFSLSNVQTVLNTLGTEMIDKFSKDIQNKCTEKETQYLNRLNKVRKAVE